MNGEGHLNVGHCFNGRPRRLTFVRGLHRVLDCYHNAFAYDVLVIWLLFALSYSLKWVAD